MYRFAPFLLLLLLAGCTSFLFVPVKPHRVPPDQVDLAYTDVFIDSSIGQQLHGWKLIADQKTAGTLLFFHGNGDNVSTQLPITFWLPREGYDVYVFDYAGYGKSEGIPQLDNTINDLELMIRHVVEQLPQDEKLIVMGHSLGASMALYSVAHSAYKERIKALVTLEAFSDYHDITQDVLSRNWLTWIFQWPLSFTVDNRYRPLDAIGMIAPIPVVIMHSETDKLVDIYHARRLYEAANQPKSFVMIDSNHNNIFGNHENRKILLENLSQLK